MKQSEWEIYVQLSLMTGLEQRPNHATMNSIINGLTCV